MADTIFALSSGAPPTAIAVVRVSGADALAVAGAVVCAGLSWFGASGIVSEDGADVLFNSGWTRVPSARSGRAGESTAMPRATSPMISTLRLPRMPTLTDTRSILPLVTICTALSATASAGTTMAEGFSR